MHRVALVASHPIQYQAPWFRALSEVCDLTVFFCHRQDPVGQASAGFGTPFEWDVPLLDGYRHEFLENVAPHPSVDRFAGCDTPGIRQRLARGRFDACIVSGWYLKSYLQAIRAARAERVPVLIRGDSNLLGERNRVTALAKAVPYRWFLQRVDGFLCVGDANRSYLRHYGVASTRMFFVPHFVDNDRFAAGADDARTSGEADRLREHWGAGPSAVIFLFVGKMIPVKRAGDFVAAVARLAREGFDARGVLVGSGPAEEALRAQAAAAGAPVVFDGFQNQSRLPARYAAADCLVLPSARESWGLVVNEAMATGLPAIVSDAVGAALDLIDGGRTGFTYPMGDGEALAARMRAAMTWRRGAAPDVHRAVLAKVAGYSAAEAVAGTVRALEAVVRQDRRARLGTGEARRG